MRKSNHVFSDPANGGILNLNQLQAKPSGPSLFSSALNIEKLLVQNSLCCMNSNDVPFDFGKPYSLSPAPAPAPAPPAFIHSFQKEDSFNEFKKFV